MKCQLFILFCINIFQLFCSARKIPPFLHVCNKNDPNLSQCIINSANDLRPYLIKGIPEMNLPAFEPFNVPKVTINTGRTSNSVDVLSEFSNMIIHGFKDFDLQEVSFDVDNLKFLMRIRLPRIEIHSDYKIKGTILLVPLDSAGTADIKFSDVVADCVAIGKRFTRKNKTYATYENSTIQVTTGPGTFILNNLFPGNPQLTDETNNLFNENIDALKKEVLPIIDKTISAIVIQILDRVSSLFSVQQLFPIK